MPPPPVPPTPTSSSPGHHHPLTLRSQLRSTTRCHHTPLHRRAEEHHWRAQTKRPPRLLALVASLHPRPTSLLPIRFSGTPVATPFASGPPEYRRTPYPRRLLLPRRRHVVHDDRRRLQPRPGKDRRAGGQRFRSIRLLAGAGDAAGSGQSGRGRSTAIEFWSTFSVREGGVGRGGRERYKDSVIFCFLF